MLFGKKRPKKFSLKRGRRSRETEDNNGEGEEKERRRIKFRRLRSNRSTGQRSLLWLFMMLIVVGALFLYLVRI